MIGAVKDTFSCCRELEGHPSIWFMSLPEAEKNGLGPVSSQPYVLRTLTETMLRKEDGRSIRSADISAFVKGSTDATAVHPDAVTFYPQRILFQDSSGLPVLADLAAVLEFVRGEKHPDPKLSLPAHLIVDHSVEVDAWASSYALEANISKEFQRNHSRYRFLKWSEKQFPWLTVVPPGSGICHQINLEVLGKIAALSPIGGGRTIAGCDSVLGTDSHTTMINAISILGWGVGGIEATAALLGEPIVIPFPKVVGVKLLGKLKRGITATDLALTLTSELRKHDLVQKFVEFYGPGMGSLSVPDRATVANMAPEYGATMGFFPADQATIEYLRATGRDEQDISLVVDFLVAQGLFYSVEAKTPVYDKIIEFDLETVEPTVAGPVSPDQKMKLSEVANTVPASDQNPGLNNGDVVIAAITSCTNTSNPRSLIAAALLARNAMQRGLAVKPWVKTSFAPGSHIASGILKKLGLQQWLDALGFQVVGFGCTTCMGNSGPLQEEIAQQVTKNSLSVAAVLSGNRNFSGRIHPLCRLTYLASPQLVVAYAIAGSVRDDIGHAPLGIDRSGKAIFLEDVLPDDAEVTALLKDAESPELAGENRRSMSVAPPQWNAIESPNESTFPWEGISGFIRKPPFLNDGLRRSQLSEDIQDARILLLLGDKITTDHISPVARILPDSEAGLWLADKGVSSSDLSSFSARRLNQDVMLRGGFANAGLDNRLTQGIKGGVTRLFPEGEILPVYKAAIIYAARGTPVVVVAGARYGAGSARDWAAKVTRLLGIRAVIAESFERIHRTNLVAMGVLPLRISRDDRLSLKGNEKLDISDLVDCLAPHGEVALRVKSPEGAERRFVLRCAIESETELNWLRAGGILPYAVHHEVA